LRKEEKSMRALAIGLLIVWGILGITVVGLCADVGKGPQENQEASVDVLLQQGSALVKAGDYKRVLDLIEGVPEQARNDIQIRTLECFANLKGWVSAKDPVYKTDWWGMRMKLMYEGDSEPTPLLVAFLQDPDPYVRKYAAELLGYIGDQRALEQLSTVQEEDDNSGVRKYAGWAHEQISSGQTPVVSGLPPLAAPRGQIPVAMETAGAIETGNRVSLVNRTRTSQVVLLAAMGFKKYYADFESWGDFIMEQLKAELQKRGVTVMAAPQEAVETPEVDHTFTITVHNVQLIPGSWATRCIVTVEVELVDGQWSHTYEGNNASPASAERAMDGAAYRLVEAIIADPDFRNTLSQ
jgi:hypothetical protein